MRINDTNNVTAALRAWVTLALQLPENRVIQAHQSGPAGGQGQLPYITITPLAGIRRIGQPSRHRIGGKYYRLQTWQITAQLDAYRGTPGQLLAACDAALSNCAIYKPAFLDRGITVHQRSEILDAPEAPAGQWENHATYRITMRYTPMLEEEVQALGGVRLKFRLGGSQQIDFQTLIEPD